jgi:hypothetical protein
MAFRSHDFELLQSIAQVSATATEISICRPMVDGSRASRLKLMVWSASPERSSVIRAYGRECHGATHASRWVVTPIRPYTNAQTLPAILTFRLRRGGGPYIPNLACDAGFGQLAQAEVRVHYHRLGVNRMRTATTRPIISTSFGYFHLRLEAGERGWGARVNISRSGSNSHQPQR